MPYSEYRIPDRKAVGQLNYQLRRFERQISDLPQERREPVNKAIERLRRAMNSALDFQDDGTPIPDQPGTWPEDE